MPPEDGSGKSTKKRRLDALESRFKGAARGGVAGASTASTRPGRQQHPNARPHRPHPAGGRGRGPHAPGARGFHGERASSAARGPPGGRGRGGGRRARDDAGGNRDGGLVGGFRGRRDGDGDGDDARNDPDDAWYARLGARASDGVMASAHARATPASLRRDAASTAAMEGGGGGGNDDDVIRGGNDDDVIRGEEARRAFVWQHLRDLVSTNPKSGADAEAVIASKTKDKVLLLDSATGAFSAEDVAKAKRTRGDGAAAAAGRRRALSSTQKKRAGLTSIPADKRKASMYAPLKELWVKYATGLLEGGAGGKGLGRGRDGDQKNAAAAAAAAVGVSRGALARLKAAELRGAEVRVDACARPSLAGIVGVVVRDTAKTLQLVTSRDVVVVVPKAGATFSFAAPVVVGDGGGGAAGGAGATVPRVVLRGEDLARG